MDPKIQGQAHHNLRTGADLPVILTAQWQAADAGASVSLFMQETWTTLGRCPY